MQKSEYLTLKNQLSFDKPLWVALLVIALDLCLLNLAVSLLKLGSTLPFLLSQVILAIFYFHNFALLHEAGHNNIHKSRWINNIVGHYASLFCFMPFFPWKHIHQGHHVWLGNIDKDPTMKPIRKIKDGAPFPALFKFSWWSWLPLSATFQLITLWLYPVRMRNEGNKDKPIFKQAIFSVAFLFIGWTALAMAFPAIVTFRNLWVSIVLYLVMSELENLPHHANMPMFRTNPIRDKLQLWEQHVPTRSCNMSPIISDLLVLNFNLHTEHHFFPTLPWYRLREARLLLEPALGTEYSAVSGIAWSAEQRATKPAIEIWTASVHHPLFDTPRQES